MTVPTCLERPYLPRSTSCEAGPFAAPCLPRASSTSVPTAASACLVVELPACLADWPDDALEAFKERASIVEFDGCLPRVDAERLAEQRVRLEWARA